jgi:collagenase-like PrtC family protease
LIKRLNGKASYKSERLPISHVYGSITGFASARETSRLAKVTDEEFSKHIDELNKLNVDFFYALNTACLGSLNTGDMLRLRKEITNLKKRGVKNFVVAHPFLLRVIKSEIPDCKIKTSVIMEIDNVKTFNFWIKEADIINVSTRINRDFTMLKALKKHKDKVEFLCNEVCLWQCPFRASHYTIESHRYKVNETYMNDYPVDLCYDMMTDVELLKARFILPEWIEYYERFGKYFKLSGRTFPQRFIEKATISYTKRQSPENILELFPIVAGSITNEQNGKRDLRNLKMSLKEKNGFLEYFKLAGNECNSRCPCPHCTPYTKCFHR